MLLKDRQESTYLLDSAATVDGGMFIDQMSQKYSSLLRKMKFFRMRYKSISYGVFGIIVFALGILLTYSIISINKLYGSGLNLEKYDYYSDYLGNGLTNATADTSAEAKIKEIGLEILNGNVPVKEYTVVSGDTLSEIAARFNVPMDFIIVASNGQISRTTVLQPGKKIYIPDRPGLIYRVKNGDVLAGLLTKYSVDFDKFILSNPHVNPDLLSYKETIFLPDAKVVSRSQYNWLRPGYGRRTSGFGWRTHPVFGYRHYHTGVDIAMYYGPVKAALSGTVTSTGSRGAYGKLVIIRHNNKFKTLYAHMSQIYVKKGTKIKRGQVIGISGNTGRSTGPHLHFEILKNGRPVNPRKYIRL